MKIVLPPCHYRNVPATRKLSVFGLLIAISLLGISAIVRFQDPGAVETDIHALLPAAARPPEVTALIEHAAERTNGQFALAIAHPNQASALGVARRLKSSLAETIPFVNFPTDSSADIAAFLPYRLTLLGQDIRSILTADRGGKDILTERMRSFVYAPHSAQLSEVLETDPLFLIPDYLQHLPAVPDFIPLEGFLVSTEGERSVVLLTGTLSESALRGDVQDALKSWLHAARSAEEKDASLEIIPIGFPWLATESAGIIQDDITNLTQASAICVFVLLFLVFRSIRTTIISSLPVALGLVSATGGALLFFPSIHLITVGFGAGLLGVAVDYAEHYLCERTKSPDLDANAVLRQLLPGLRAAFLTSVLGYTLIGLPAFPALRQIAVFSVLGLLGAYLTVIFLYPELTARRVAARSKKAPLLAGIISRMWQNGLFRTRWTLAALCLAGMTVLLGGLSQLRIDDNVRVLSPLSTERLAREKRFALGGTDTRFFLAAGRSEEEADAKEQTLIEALERLIDEGALSGYIARGVLLPPSSVQIKQARELCARILAEREALSAFAAEIGLSTAVIEKLVTECLSPPVIAAPDSPLPESLRRYAASLHLADGESGLFGRIILLQGIKDTETIMRAATPEQGVYFIDRASEATQLLKEYRQIALWTIGASFLVMIIFFFVRYRRQKAFFACLLPAAAILGTLSAMGWAAVPLNLFSTFALLLILETAIDYSIFMSEEADDINSTMLAISICAFTSVLSFGVLAFSAVPVLRSFGFPVAVGILLSLFLAPIVRLRNWKGALLPVAALIAGCHTIPLHHGDFHPEEAVVRIRIESGEEEKIFTAYLEQTESARTVVLMNPLGLRAVSIHQKGQSVTIDDSPLSGLPIDPRWLLAAFDTCETEVARCCQWSFRVSSEAAIELTSVAASGELCRVSSSQKS